MKATIITIDFGQYTENVIVNEQNADEARSTIKAAKGYAVFFQGDYVFSLSTTKIEDVEICQYDSNAAPKKEYTERFETKIVNGKKLYKMVDGCGQNLRFQKLKSTTYGQYLTLFGTRWYINS
jgi:hypothetical protein